MKKILINYSDKAFESKQKWNSFSGKVFGSFDDVIEFGPDDLDEHFLRKNNHILKHSRGGGYWMWKPYIVLKTLEKVNEGDLIFYCDSGVVFIKSIDPLCAILQESNKDILTFQLPLIEKQWTKRDAFVLLNCDTPEFTDTPQVLGGYFLVKKNNKSVEFFKKFLSFAEDERILTDISNKLGKTNYLEFIDHRHDQSLLSLLSKNSDDVLIYSDPSDYGVFPKKYLHRKEYLYVPQLLNSNNDSVKGILLVNRKVHPLNYLFKYFLKRSLKFFKVER